MNLELKTELERRILTLSKEVTFTETGMKEKLIQFLEFLIGTSIGGDEIDFVSNLINDKTSELFDKRRDRIVSRFRGRMLSDDWSNTVNDKKTGSSTLLKMDDKKVFIVHGHDDASRELVARFLQKLGLNPIILHEQANQSLTVIEKLEKHSDVRFAVVLMTPDDLGSKRSTEPVLVNRARQNVLIELGYFVGKLGRGNVCTLRVGDTEVPSDFSGVVYTDMDQSGGWRTKLAQELISAKFSIELSALIS